METKKNKKGLIWFAVILLGCAAIALTAYLLTRPAGVAGGKSITIVMDAADGAPVTREITTEEEFLGPLLLAEGLAEGETSEFGLFLTMVNGVAANEEKQEWWCITKAGAEVFTGVDETPLADGDQYELTLMTGY